MAMIGRRVLEFPQQRVWHVYRTGAHRKHRQHVAAHRVAHHAEPFGSNMQALDDARVRSGILFRDDLDPLEVMREPTCLDLRGLMDEVALGDEDQTMGMTHLLEHAGHISQQAHGFGEHLAHHLTKLRDDRHWQTFTRNGGSGLEH